MSNDTTAPWLQLTLEAIDHSSEQLEDALLQAGALAVTLEDAGDQPVLEPAPGETPLWLHTCVTGLFDAQTDIEVIKGRLRRFLHTPDLPECRLTALEERDWVRAWLDHFHPMRFGQRLWICPTCQTPPDPEGRVVAGRLVARRSEGRSEGRSVGGRRESVGGRRRVSSPV